MDGEQRIRFPPPARQREAALGAGPLQSPAGEQGWALSPGKAKKTDTYRELRPSRLFF